MSIREYSVHMGCILKLFTKMENWKLKFRNQLHIVHVQFNLKLVLCRIVFAIIIKYKSLLEYKQYIFKNIE